MNVSVGILYLTVTLHWYQPQDRKADNQLYIQLYIQQLLEFPVLKPNKHSWNHLPKNIFFFPSKTISEITSFPNAWELWELSRCWPFKRVSHSLSFMQLAANCLPNHLHFLYFFSLKQQKWCRSRATVIFWLTRKHPCRPDFAFTEAPHPPLFQSMSKKKQRKIKCWSVRNPEKRAFYFIFYCIN